MKNRTKTHKKKSAKHMTNLKSESLPIGMQETWEIPAAETKWPSSSAAFTAMETGQPDTDPVADIKNPQGVQSGRGPTNQEGEGDRQNDELAELEQIEPKSRQEFDV